MLEAILTASMAETTDLVVAVLRCLDLGYGLAVSTWVNGISPCMVSGLGSTNPNSNCCNISGGNLDRASWPGDLDLDLERRKKNYSWEPLINPHRQTKTCWGRNHLQLKINPKTNHFFGYKMIDNKFRELESCNFWGNWLTVLKNDTFQNFQYIQNYTIW